MVGPDASGGADADEWFATRLSRKFSGRVDGG